MTFTLYNAPQSTCSQRVRFVLNTKGLGFREVLQTHFGAATLQKNPKEYLSKDFAALAETMALAAGMKLTPENKNVGTGLE